MTETVLLTDEDGAFTCICPNVRFIFGYTVREIRELGTVEELLGEDSFDPDVLEERGHRERRTDGSRQGRRGTHPVDQRETRLDRGGNDAH
jgi:hypothetical protein